MNIRDFRIGWRLLMSEPAYSAVVVFGLTIGFAACILILSFVYSTLQYNAHIPDSQRIYMLTIRDNTGDHPQWSEFMPLPLRNAAIQSGLGASTTVVMKIPVKIKVNSAVKQFLLRAVDPGFQDVFGIKAVAGDLRSALSHPDSVALTLGTAQQLFGETDVLGKTLQIDGKLFNVAALLSDPPATTTVPYSILTGIGTAAISEADRKMVLEDWCNSYGKIYVKLSSKSSPQAMQAALQLAFDSSPAVNRLSLDKLQRPGKRKMFDVGMAALSEVYFSPDFAYAANSLNDDRRYGDRHGILGLTAIALLILVLASTNYVNLATVRLLRRQREIGLRKLLGASIGHIVRLFMAESLLVSLASTTLGLLLAWLLLPLFSNLINRQLGSQFSDVAQRPLAQLLTPTVIGYCLLLGVAVGIISSAYPIWIANKVRIANALTGRVSGESSDGLGQWLHRILTVLQFSVAMAITGVALTITFQVDFAMKSNPGFDPAPLLIIPVPFDAPQDVTKSLQGALARLPDVSSVTSESHAVGSGEHALISEVQNTRGEHISVSDVGVGPEFFQVYGVPALAGRVFDPAVDREDNGEDIVLNRTAAHALGFTSPEAAVGQLLNHRTSDGNEVSMRVLGVVPDIRHENLRSAPQPIVYQLPHTSSYLTLRTERDIAGVELAIRKVWPQYFPNDALDIRHPKDYIERSYASDVQLAKILAAASVVAIAIAAFGIYVLAAYTVRRRAKTIALHKLHGAKHRHIASLVGREFIVLIALAGLIGLPIAAVAIQRYLSAFVERTPISNWTLLMALLVALLVTLVSTASHTMFAMRMNPARLFRR